MGRIVGILRADGRAVRLFGRRNHGNPHPGRDSEGRAIRASQTGVKPHFTAIAEVFRQAVAENAGHKITLYNDFSGRTESAMELTCM